MGIVKRPQQQEEEVSMEKRRRNEPVHWVTPGVFTGTIHVQETLEQECVNNLPVRAREETALTQKIQALEEEMQTLKNQLQELEKKWAQFVKNNQREREHLYQVVLSLKKEWEMERDEHRHR
jgi:dynactin complex subunit